MESQDKSKAGFKKPILIGKIGKFPKTLPETTTTKGRSERIPLTQKSNTEQGKLMKIVETVSENVDQTQIAPAQQLADKLVALPYKEPKWSGLPDPDTEYAFEILKQGSIIGNLALKDRAFWIFGKLPQCDITMAHPTISRYHAVLQYRSENSEQNTKGFYLYDLDSTHGTFVNKLRVKPRHYVRIQVGHMIKFGCSSRNFILTGPQDDQEKESALTITEMKQQRKDELEKRRLAALKAEEDRIAKEKRDEDRGVDWGMGEDADEETDLSENPYAQTNNEELYLDDPKKALRGFMEREGVAFEYDCTEQGIGQFLCKVALPVDDDRGRPITAEVLHKGKKKEAVVQCALEACRILDRHGVLRQATHESKKRKTKNWEQDDYYDSDDDTYLDRTGTIERKRERRMKAKQPQLAETYSSLLAKEKTISNEIQRIEGELVTSRTAAQKVDDAADSLDAFMEGLKQPTLDTDTVIKLKSSLVKLKLEHANVIRLANIARPADLPPLTQTHNTNLKQDKLKSKFPMFGKRFKLKVSKPQIEKLDEKRQIVDEKLLTDEKIPSETKETETIDEKPSEKLENKVSISPEKQENEEVDEEKLKEELEKKRKKNQKRIQQRLERQEAEKQRGYQEDFSKEDYNMWVPPTGQTGDGKTSLNDKFGY